MIAVLLSAFLASIVEGQSPVPAAQVTALDAVLTAMNCPTTGDNGCPRASASDLCGDNRPLYVECSPTGDIVQLNVGAKGAVGSISTAIAQLSALTRLEMRANNFSGSGVPSQIGQMTNLVWLDLGACGLEGTVPTEIVRLTALSYLKLSENALRGQFPAPLSSRLSLTGLNCALFDYAPAEKNCFDTCPRAQCTCALVNCSQSGVPASVGVAPATTTSTATGALVTTTRGTVTTTRGTASGVLLSLVVLVLAAVCSVA
jgi:hypothetical protein